MFENYPTYARQVLAAATAMPEGKKSIGTKFVVGAVAAVIAGAGTVVASGNAVELMQVNEALGSVSGDIQAAPVEVKVETDGLTLAELLGDENGLSATEQVQIAEQIKASINAEDLSNATGRMVDENTAEITIVTADSIPVTVTVVKDSEGSYKIESVVAQLDKTAAAAQKENVNNPNSTDSQKSANAKPLADFNVAAFDAAIGLEADTNGEDALGAYARQMSVLADDVVMAVPDGFEVQEVEQPEVVGEGDSEAESADDAAENAASAEETVAAKADAEEAEKPSFKPYNRSWKTSDGSSISVRAEDLGEAFSQMNGLDAVNKMMGYWKETSESVANGAGQSMKDEAAGFVTEVFYDEESGLWGYWGTVSFTDGNRDIVYNRVVFIDELSDQMVTVSYRHDGAVDAGGALSLDDYKQLFSHRVAADEDSDHGKAAASTYAEKLSEIGLSVDGSKVGETKVEMKEE